MRLFITNLSGPGMFAWAVQIAVRSEGKWIYVTDQENENIQVFNADGTYSHMWGYRGTDEVFVFIYLCVFLSITLCVCVDLSVLFMFSYLSICRVRLPILGASRWRYDY